MIRKLLSIVSTFAFAATVFGQGIVQKSYDFGGDDYSNKMVVNDHGLTTVGSTTATGAGGYDASLMSFDTAGILLWQKQYGGSRTEYGTAAAGDTSGYYIVGRTNSFTTNHDQDILLIKTDLNGNLLWAKSYGSDSTEVASAVALLPNGSVAITGQTRAFSAGGTKMFLIVTDSVGNLVSGHTYGSTGNEIGSSVTFTGDGGFLLLGYTDVGTAGLQDIYAVKTDATGGIQAQLVIGGAGDEGGLAFLGNNQSYIAIGGTTASNAASVDQIYVMQINTSTFTVDWANQYGGGVNDQLTSLFQNGKGYAISGGSTSFGNASQGLIFGIDSAGNLQGGETIGGAGNEYLQDIFIAGDGSIITTGSTNSYGGTASDVLLIKSDANGSLCNDFQGANVTKTAWTPTIVGPVVPNHAAQNAAFTVNSLTLTQSTNAGVVHDLCLSTGVEKVKELSVSVMPNPSNGNFTIDLSKLSSEENHINIFDVTGKEVYSNVLPSTKVNVTLPQAAGMYVVRIESNKQFFYKKLIVE